MQKPEAVPAALKCSVCGLDWRKHGSKPTLEKCVELLKAEKARPNFEKEWVVQSKPFATLAEPFPIEPSRLPKEPRE